MSESRQMGVYSALQINGETNAVKKMLKDVPEKLGSIVDRSRITLTLTEPAETVVDVITDIDKLALRRISQRTLEFLGDVPLSAAVLRPQEQRFQKFGRFLAVPVVRCDFISFLRSGIDDIFSEETSRHLSSGSYEPHLSLVRLRSGSSGRAERKNHRPHFPDFHVRGFMVGSSDMTQYAERQRSRQSYINKPSR